jgi:hypothetical protein
MCMCTALDMGNDQESTYRGDSKRQQSMLAHRMVRIVERDSQSVSENRGGLLEGHYVVLGVSRRFLWIPTELHARIIEELPYQRLTSRMTRCEAVGVDAVVSGHSANAEARPLDFAHGEARRARRCAPTARRRR